jgi:hypothetical protein
MLHLYFAAFGAVAAANVIAVIAIAAMIKRTRSRFWPRWLWPPPLKMALSPFCGNTGGFGAYLIVLRKRFAMTLHILGIAVEETDNPQPECKANPVDQFWLAASFLWGP